ncbi:S8 family serine peptidase [Oceanobacillus halotolerans]|uniref:S8 family serine peptidase n=1 Tax=Oceanobacillus halotolerans TaxID=2663380 RepID=UPI0013DCD56C|nr:S8 family serine peptidase [Oceanobacillus halotolerans]
MIFPIQGAADDGITSSHNKLKEHTENMEASEVKPSKSYTDQAGVLLEQYNYLKEKPIKRSIGISSKKTIKNIEEIDDDQADLRQYYQKQNQAQLKSIPQINLDDVNDRSIIVRVKDGETLDYEAYDVQLVEESTFLQEKGLYFVRVPADHDYEETLKKLKNTKHVRSAEPDYLMESTMTPTDPEMGRQWYLNKIGMTDAWDITEGSSDVTVAVLDTGVNATHEDLSGRVLAGYDYVNDDSDPSDDHGHGTHVAGIIASNTNDIGVTGIDFHANILPVKVANVKGEVPTSNSIKGIYYAISQGADVINMSYGGYNYDESVEEAIQEAYDQGIVVVAAAGNDGIDSYSYPASYTSVISVSATDENDQPTSFTNYGNFIDITAPGSNIYSTDYLGGYKGKNGTSFSSPIVSAVAGLLKAKHPDWAPNEIEWALQAGAEQLVNMEWNTFDGYGRVNAYSALTTTLPALDQDIANNQEEAKEIKSGSVYSDKVDLPKDVDWYTFEVTEKSSVTIDVINNSYHLDLIGSLYKTDGDAVLDRHIIDYNLSGSDEWYSFEAEPGTYYIAIYDYFNHWSEQPYELTMESSTINNTDLIVETEPNDYMDQASYIHYGSMGGGYFQQYKDYDYYQVDLPYNGDIAIKASTDSTAYYNEPVALLVDSYGDVIVEDDYYWQNNGELKSNTNEYHRIQTGTYYVVITNLEDYSDNNPYVFDITYLENEVEEVPVPVASIESGTYTGAINVKLNSYEGNEIRYTLDGSDPSLSNGTVYEAPIEIEVDTTLKAIAVKDGHISNVVTYLYEIDNVLNAPIASKTSGAFTEAFQLELTTNISEASIYYTLDGTTPSVDNGQLYEEPIWIDQDTNVKAFAILDDLTSDVRSYSYDYSAFPDINGHWAEDTITFLVEKGILNGYPDGTFGPGDLIGRAQAAKIIVEEMGLPLAESDFPDVPDDYWASEHIGAAVEAGIFTGYDDGTFRPTDTLTRSEAAIILVRAYNLEGSSEMTFPDVDESLWSYPFIETLVANGIITGYPDGTFGPKDSINRGQFSTMMARVLGFESE